MPLSNDRISQTNCNKRDPKDAKDVAEMLIDELNSTLTDLIPNAKHQLELIIDHLDGHSNLTIDKSVEEIKEVVDFIAKDTDAVIESAIQNGVNVTDCISDIFYEQLNNSIIITEINVRNCTYSIVDDGRKNFISTMENLEEMVGIPNALNATLNLCDITQEDPLMCIGDVIKNATTSITIIPEEIKQIMIESITKAIDFETDIEACGDNFTLDVVNDIKENFTNVLDCIQTAGKKLHED